MLPEEWVEALEEFDPEREETDYDPQGILNRLDPYIEKLSSEGKYNIYSCMAFTVKYISCIILLRNTNISLFFFIHFYNTHETLKINYVLGIGYIGIPFSFLQSGYILGPISLLLVFVLCYITVMWVAEVSHRGLQVLKVSFITSFVITYTCMK